MAQPRDLVAERKQYTVAKETLAEAERLQADAAAAAAAAAVPEPPAKRKRSSTDELDERFTDVTAADFNPYVNGSMVVELGEQFIDAMVMADKVDEVALEGAQAVQGVFFNTFVVVNGQYVWRQLQPVNDSTPIMMMWHSPEGWWCSSVLWISENQRKQRKPLIGLWGAVQDSGDLPVHWHCPYWTDKPNHEIYCRSTFEMYYASAEHAAAFDAVQEAAKQQKAHIAKLNEKHIELGLDAMDIAYTDSVRQLLESLPPPAAAAPDASEAAASTAIVASHAAHGQPQSKQKARGEHGGWMVRATSLMVAVYKLDYPRAHEIVSHWYEQYPQIKVEFDKKIAEANNYL